MKEEFYLLGNTAVQAIESQTTFQNTVRRLTFNRLHGVIFQKTELFINTALGALNIIYK
jgi:hypothetical protein